MTGELVYHSERPVKFIDFTIQLMEKTIECIKKDIEKVKKEGMDFDLLVNRAFELDRLLKEKVKENREK